MNAAPSSSLVTDMRRTVAGEVSENEPLAPKLSIRTGGAAELYVRPWDFNDVVRVLQYVKLEGLALTVLGGGNNTLVGDGGVPGVTLKLPANLAVEEVAATERGGRVTLGGGAAIVRLIHQMKLNGWVGAEALAGIPGTLGGAVTMNAGTKNGECMASVDAVELATADGIGWVERRELSFRYRHTELPKDSVVTRVRFVLLRGDVDASKAAMDADLAYRRRSQPLSQPNFGSVFTNPTGHHAGALIDGVGLKGHIVGAAQISPLHANWIVNLGGAMAADVVALMSLMQARVFEATGVELTPEVKRMGVFQ